MWRHDKKDEFLLFSCSLNGAAPGITDRRESDECLDGRSSDSWFYGSVDRYEGLVGMASKRRVLTAQVPFH